MRPDQSPKVVAWCEREKRRVAEDPYYAIKKGYVFTEDEKRGGEKRPMPDTLYLYILTRLWQLYSIGMIRKVRQMILSWLECWLSLHETIFSPGSLNILQGKRLDDIKAIGTKSLMGRCLFINRNLPDWLRPDVELEATDDGKRTLTSMVVPGGGVLIAAPQGPDIVRSKTATSLCMDELAFHPDGPAAWQAALPTVNDAEPIIYPKNPDWLLEWNERFPAFAHDWTKGRFRARLWGVTTPNGHERLVDPMVKWSGRRHWPELTGHKYESGLPVDGLRVELKEQRYEGFTLPPICCVSLHYTAELAPERWERRRASRAAYDSDAAYEQENELSSRSAAGQPVFRPQEFTSLHMKKYQPVTYRPTVISIDAGYQGQSVCFWQESMVKVGSGIFRRGHLFYHFLWKARTLDEVIWEIKQQLAARGIDWRRVKYVCDWNTLNTHHGGVGISDMQVFHQNGIYPVARRVGANQKNQAINLARRGLKMWPDGRPGTEIDPDGAPLVVEMLDGSWRYSEPAPGKGLVEIPLKDGTYDHVGDSFVYRFWCLEGEIWGGAENLLIPQDEAPEEGQTSKIKEWFLKNRQRKLNRANPNMVGPSNMT